MVARFCRDQIVDEIIAVCAFRIARDLGDDVRRPGSRA